jgi:hypothetical protein
MTDTAAQPAVRTDTRWMRLALRAWPWLPGDLGLRLFLWAARRATVEAQYLARPPIPMGRLGDHFDD